MLPVNIIDIVSNFFVKDDSFLTENGILLVEKLQKSLSESTLLINLTSTVIETLQLFIVTFWERVQNNGLGLAQIDDLIVVLIIIRLVILAIRYNIITAFSITTIGIFAGYLWYSAFISLLFIYEHALYKNSLTFQLGVDATQLRRAIETRVQSSNYQIRLTNPIGVIAYAIGNGSLYENHRIDLVSMVVSKIPDKFFKQDIECYYYLFYRKIIPISIRSILDFIDLFTGYAIYAFMTRVNKRYCPYLIRWHWTLLLIFKFVEPFIVYFIYRITDYSSKIVYPQLVESQNLTLTLSQQNIEFMLLMLICFIIIVFHLGFVLFGMFHALCGQYFYVPFFTENVELHIGPKDTYSIYSGGYTAWQDPDEKSKNGFASKIWYGWFGRGTKNKNSFFGKIYTFFYKIIKKIIKIIRKKNNL